MKESTKLGLSIVSGIIMGITACVVSYPYLEPKIHDLAEQGVMLIIKPLGGTLSHHVKQEPHPESGKFEHEVKRTE